jgi:hypothetical protein
MEKTTNPSPVKAVRILEIMPTSIRKNPPLSIFPQPLKHEFSGTLRLGVCG